MLIEETPYTRRSTCHLRQILPQGSRTPGEVCFTNSHPHWVQNVHHLLQKYHFDYCVGSIHHVLGISIDYNTDLWVKAQEACGGTDELLYCKYFDEQYDLLTNIKPLVIGHFDVIRLWSPDKMVRLRQWPSVWEKILRNIDVVISYDGLFELNSSAFRKGFPEAYPTSEIATVQLTVYLINEVGNTRERGQICSVR
jgi:HisJ family histidinol phosphate phosphatase